MLNAHIFGELELGCYVLSIICPVFPLFFFFWFFLCFFLFEDPPLVTISFRSLYLKRKLKKRTTVIYIGTGEYSSDYTTSIFNLQLFHFLYRF